MLLIATITGAIADNYRESLNQGKVFKTKEAISRIETVLNLELAEKPMAGNEIQQSWQEVVKHSPLVRDPANFVIDGWGSTYQVTLEHSEEGQPYFKVKSENLERYEHNKGGR